MQKEKVHYWKLFFKIVIKSRIQYMFIIFLALYFTFSAAIYYYDKAAFPSYGDAMWFTFVSLFTIGYGDFTVHTTLSRILTVILVIYGSVIIAVFTGIWVNLISKVTDTVVLGENKETYEKLCNLDNLDHHELKKLASLFKKKKINKS